MSFVPMSASRSECAVEIVCVLFPCRPKRGLSRLKTQTITIHPRAKTREKNQDNTQFAALFGALSHPVYDWPILVFCQSSLSHHLVDVGRADFAVGYF